MHPGIDTFPIHSVTAGLIDRDQLMADLRCSDRTLDRYRQAGMPFIRLGNKTLYDPAAVREWIISHQRRHNAPKVGRPRKHAA